MPMKTVLHLTWEYPPWAVGDLSSYLKQRLPSIAKKMPLALVVRGNYDRVSEIDGMRLYETGMSIKTAPNILAFAHSMNVDLLRRACQAINEIDSISAIHTHDWISSIAGVNLSRCFDMPLIISVYTTETTRTRAINSILSMGIFDIEKYCFKKARMLIIRSPDIKKTLCTSYGINEGNILEADDDASIIRLYQRVLK
jgi:hypothetical protein